MKLYKLIKSLSNFKQLPIAALKANYPLMMDRVDGSNEENHIMQKGDKA
jgi:hypothetical protein